MTRIQVVASSLLSLLLVGCSSPTGRSSATTLDRFVQALRQQGLVVNPAGQAMIVLYVGCAAEIVDALQKTVGPPIAVGATPCNIAGNFRPQYIHALGLRSLNRLYDPLFRLTMPERAFRGQLLEQARLAADLRILDIGCGTGTLLLDA